MSTQSSASAARKEITQPIITSTTNSGQARTFWSKELGSFRPQGSEDFFEFADRLISTGLLELQFITNSGVQDDKVSIEFFGGNERAPVITVTADPSKAIEKDEAQSLLADFMKAFEDNRQKIKTSGQNLALHRMERNRNTDEALVRSGNTSACNM